MQKWLLCDIPSKSYKMLNIAMYDIIQTLQRFGLIYVLPRADQEANVWLHLFKSKFSLKKEFVIINCRLWYNN